MKIWRRSFDVPPLKMEADHKCGRGAAPPPLRGCSPQRRYYEAIQKDPRYADVPEGEMPDCESLDLTIKRSMP